MHYFKRGMALLPAPNTHARTHTHIRTHACTHARTHIHTQIHTHALWNELALCTVNLLVQG